MVFGLISVLSFMSSFVETYLMQAVAYFSTHTRAWDLAIGGMLALTADRWSRLSPRAAWFIGSAGLALLLLVCNQFQSTIPYPGSAALLPMIASVMVIAAGCALPTRGAGRVLAWAPMRTVGRLSYSWYLWHWPLLVLVPIVLGHPLGLAGRVALVLVSGGLGAVTLRYIENPLRYAGPLRRSYKRSLAVGGAFTAVAACVGLVLLTVVQPPVGHGSPAPALMITTAPVPPGSSIAAYDAAVRQAFAQTQAAVVRSADLQVVPSNLDPSLAGVAQELKDIYFGGCLRTPVEQGHPECATGDTSSPTTVAVIGDSNAAMFFPAFQQAVGARHWRLLMLAKGNCPMIDLPNSDLARPAGGTLSTLPGMAPGHPDRLLAAPPAAGRGEYVAGIRHRRGVDGFPCVRRGVAGPPDPPRTATAQGWFQSAGAGAHPECRQSRAHVRVRPSCRCFGVRIVEIQGLQPSRAWPQRPASPSRPADHYADLTDLFCTTDRCPVIVGNNLVYLDKTHMTLAYSRTLGPAMGALADRSACPEWVDRSAPSRTASRFLLVGDFART